MWVKDKMNSSIYLEYVNHIVNICRIWSRDCSNYNIYLSMNSILYYCYTRFLITTIQNRLDVIAHRPLAYHISLSFKLKHYTNFSIILNFYSIFLSSAILANSSLSLANSLFNSARESPANRNFNSFTFMFSKMFFFQISANFLHIYQNLLNLFFYLHIPYLHSNI